MSLVQGFWKSGSLGAIRRHVNACRASSCTQQGTSPPLKEGVGGPASCLGLRGRKHPNVSPGSRSRQHNCVGNCKQCGDFSWPYPTLVHSCLEGKMFFCSGQGGGVISSPFRSHPVYSIRSGTGTAILGAREALNAFLTFLYTSAVTFVAWM